MATLRQKLQDYLAIASQLFPATAPIGQNYLVGRVRQAASDVSRRGLVPVAASSFADTIKQYQDVASGAASLAGRVAFGPNNGVVEGQATPYRFATKPQPKPQPAAQPSIPGYNYVDTTTTGPGGVSGLKPIDFGGINRTYNRFTLPAQVGGSNPALDYRNKVQHLTNIARAYETAGMPKIGQVTKIQRQQSVRDARKFEKDQQAAHDQALVDAAKAEAVSAITTFGTKENIKLNNAYNLRSASAEYKSNLDNYERDAKFQDRVSKFGGYLASAYKDTLTKLVASHPRGKAGLEEDLINFLGTNPGAKLTPDDVQAFIESLQNPK